MTATNFDACLAVILQNEGGYVNDPQDPGGETNYGISKRAYPTLDIANLTQREAGLIYRRDYWDKLNGDSLPDGLDLVAFDAGVNSGIGAGAKWLQQALGVTDDGQIGPMTIAAAKASDKHFVITDACAIRLGHLQTYGGWARFGAGWAARVNHVQATALGMIHA